MESPLTHTYTQPVGPPRLHGCPLLLPDDAAGGVEVHGRHLAHEGPRRAVLVDGQAKLGARESRGLVSILDRNADCGHVFEGPFADVLGIDEGIGGLHSESVRAAGLEVQRLWREAGRFRTSRNRGEEEK